MTEKLCDNALFNKSQKKMLHYNETGYDFTICLITHNLPLPLTVLQVLVYVFILKLCHFLNYWDKIFMVNPDGDPVFILRQDVDVNGLQAGLAILSSIFVLTITVYLIYKIGKSLYNFLEFIFLSKAYAQGENATFINWNTLKNLLTIKDLKIKALIIETVKYNSYLTYYYPAFYYKNHCVKTNLIGYIVFYNAFLCESYINQYSRWYKKHDQKLESKMLAKEAKKSRDKSIYEDLLKDLKEKVGDTDVV